MHPLFRCFPVLIGNHLANIWKPYSLAYSKPRQTFKMEPLARTVMRKTLFPLKTYSFFMISWDGGSTKFS